MAVQLGFSTFHGTVAWNAAQGKLAYMDTRGSGATSSPCLQTQERFLSPVKSFQCLANCYRKQFIDSAILMFQINIKGSTDRISM